jgi:hypothetical protein
MCRLKPNVPFHNLIYFRAPKGAVESLPSSEAACRQPTDRRWYSAPVAKTEAGYFAFPAATELPNDAGSRTGSCSELGAKAATKDEVVEAATDGHSLSRRLPQDTMLDLTTSATSRPDSYTSTNGTVAPQTPRPRSSRQSSEPLGSTSRPGSGRHAVLPPIQQYHHSADAVAVRGS